jgi:hypothetical protein
VLDYIIQSDKKKVCVHLMKNSVYSSISHTIDDFKVPIRECIRNVDGAILNTVFENTFRRVNKGLDTGSVHFELYL